jgi:hypothetical protein
MARRCRMLNGFRVRLVVPGWFATYWVKALSQITVRTEPLLNFWMDTAYRVPTTPDFSEDQSIPASKLPLSPVIQHGRSLWRRNPPRNSRRTRRSRSKALPSMMARAFGALKYRQTAGGPGLCGPGSCDRQILLEAMANELASDRSSAVQSAMRCEQRRRRNADDL